MSLHRQSLTQAKRIGDRVSQPSPGEGEAVKAALKGPESHYHLPPTVATAEGPQGSRPVTGSEQDTNNAYSQVRFLDREDPLQKEMAIHSSTLAWKIP